MNLILIALFLVAIVLFSYMIYIDRKELKEVRELKREVEERFEIRKHTVH